MNAPKGPDEPGGTPLSEQLRERFDRATESARRWIERAQEIARERGFAGTTLGAGAGAGTSAPGSSELLAAGPLAANRTAVSSAQVERPEPTSMLDREAPPGGYGHARARALPVDPHTVVLFWEWPADHVPLQRGDVLVLQLVSTLVIEGEPVAFTQWADHLPPTGDYFFRGLPPGATHQAFVGVLREGVFESVLYTEPVETPHGEPTAEVAVLRATLLLPARTEGKPGVVPAVSPEAKGPRIVRIEGPAPAIEALVGEPPAAQWHGVERVETGVPEYGEGVPFGPRPAEFESGEAGSEGARKTDRVQWSPSSWRRFSPGSW